jgi:hypothetical protein
LLRPTGWRSYDEVAQTYENVAVPWFTPLARDLVAEVGLYAGARVLDVGTGTGLVAELARGSACGRPRRQAFGRAHAVRHQERRRPPDRRTDGKMFWVRPVVVWGSTALKG